MKVGLVHGRFQPFHNGHKFLVNKMLKECDVGVILIGSVGKRDKKNLFSLEERKNMVRKIYGKNKKLFIGANIDLDSPYSKNAQWDVVLSSCVLSLVGKLPTKVYSGKDYSVPWERVKVKINEFERYDNISGTDIKKLIYEKNLEEVKSLVPKEVFRTIRERF
jgi:cytidyltransferase-like protein